MYVYTDIMTDSISDAVNVHSNMMHNFVKCFFVYHLDHDCCPKVKFSVIRHSYRYIYKSSRSDKQGVNKINVSLWHSKVCTYATFDASTNISLPYS